MIPPGWSPGDPRECDGAAQVLQIVSCLCFLCTFWKFSGIVTSVSAIVTIAGPAGGKPPGPVGPAGQTIFVGIPFSLSYIISGIPFELSSPRKPTLSCINFGNTFILGKTIPTAHKPITPKSVPSPWTPCTFFLNLAGVSSGWSLQHPSLP